MRFIHRLPLILVASFFIWFYGEQYLIIGAVFSFIIFAFLEFCNHIEVRNLNRKIEDLQK